MKRLLMTIALTCVLSGSVLAGEMPTCGVSAPAPGGIQSSAVVTVLLTIISIVV